MDRNAVPVGIRAFARIVALRKESVDRNSELGTDEALEVVSLSARRAWIEIDAQ